MSYGVRSWQRCAVGALVGGTLGLRSASGKSSSKKARNVIVGAVEKAGDTANIRRVCASFCDPANAQAVESVAGEMQREAEECPAAKQQLVDATTSSAAELAAKKIKLLCND